MYTKGPSAGFNFEHENMSRVRKDRGNIILTALFVAIFLFFLSVALLYQNRQDIALSLSMEHKLKAQAGARSFAMEIYGHLRQFGELRRQPVKEADGVDYRVELVSVPPNGDRGKVLQVRSRATSGPVSSYYTIHLLETEMVDQASGNPLIFFPGGGTSGVLRTDFVLRDLEVALEGNVVARDGPIMKATAAVGKSQPQFLGYIPIFPESGSTLRAFGPVLTVGPPTPTGEETSLQWLDYSGSTIEWQSIPAPENLAPDGLRLQTEPQVVALEAPASQWTNISLNGVNDQFQNYIWTDEEPSTGSIDEAQNLVVGERYQAGALVDWSTIPAQESQEWFVTRGTIAAQGRVLYSHGWHYLFRPYNGRLADPVTALDGPQITRWPCVLAYNIDSEQWRKVWAPMDTSGNVKTSHRPNPLVLMVKSGGGVVSATEGEQPHLLNLQEGGAATIGGLVTQPEKMFLYRDEAHIVNDAGQIQSVESGSTISFASLPDRIPEVYGELWEVPEADVKGLEEFGANDLSPDGALELTSTTLTTISPEILLSYRVTEGAKPALIGRELLTSVDISILTRNVGRPAWDNEKIPKGGTTLARFDGTQWHILPSGLRALLEYQRHHSRLGSDEETEVVGGDLGAPTGSSNLLVGDYPDSTQPLSRYTIISVDTNPFEFGK